MRLFACGWRKQRHAAQPTRRAAAARGELGRRGEAAARRFLQSQGYRIERTNVRYPVGELDIVAYDGDVLCFIEVRSTSSQRWGGPLASITDAKRQRIIRAARWDVQGRRELPQELRFDIVAVTWDDAGAPSLELVKGAFHAD